MTVDPELPDDADPADVLEQHQDLVPPSEDPEAIEPEPDELPLEANEADVAEQWTEAASGADDDAEEPDS
jgi:hypothetical protein